MSYQHDTVWLIEERTYGQLVQWGAYFSMIKFTKDGMEYQILVENDEFEVVEEEDE